jgi:hypothetical protein
VTDQKGAAEITVDVENLHREEVFSDLQAASVRRLTPVKADGSTDTSRDIIYIGETNLMTQMGPLPVQFPIEAKSLDDAFSQFAEGVKGAIERLNERAKEMVREESQFAEGVKGAIERLNERAKEMVREESSRIVVPGAAPPGMGGAGIPGARPGSGKFLFDK